LALFPNMTILHVGASVRAVCLSYGHPLPRAT
jgi:hypothetical protein